MYVVELSVNVELVLNFQMARQFVNRNFSITTAYYYAIICIGVLRYAYVYLKQTLVDDQTPTF